MSFIIFILSLEDEKPHPFGLIKRERKEPSNNLIPSSSDKNESRPDRKDE